MRLRSLPSIEQGRRTEVSFGIWPFAIHYAARRRVLTTRPVATCDDLRLQLCADDRESPPGVAATSEASSLRRRSLTSMVIIGGITR